MDLISIEIPLARILLRLLAVVVILIAVWPFVLPKDYLTFRYDIVEQGKLRLEAAGLTIPFPQRDVHLYPAAPQLEQ